MRPMGFSTGSLALGNVHAGVETAMRTGTDAIELSALRAGELAPLADAVERLDLHGFGHVSVHAPSRFSRKEERAVAKQLCSFVERGWPIVLHPDAIHSFKLWRTFGHMLLIENMDKRKPCGRTSTELAVIFDDLPDARLCFDIAHARQVDASMLEAFRILRDWGNRVAQIHISEVTTSSRHARISPSAVRDFQEVAALIPPHVPVILETPVDLMTAESDLSRAREALEIPSSISA